MQHGWLKDFLTWIILICIRVATKDFLHYRKQKHSTEYPHATPYRRMIIYNKRTLEIRRIFDWILSYRSCVQINNFFITVIESFFYVIFPRFGQEMEEYIAKETAYGKT